MDKGHKNKNVMVGKEADDFLASLKKQQMAAKMHHRNPKNWPKGKVTKAEAHAKFSSDR